VIGVYQDRYGGVIVAQLI